jgi:hypothetical protein
MPPELVSYATACPRWFRLGDARLQAMEVILSDDCSATPQGHKGVSRCTSFDSDKVVRQKQRFLWTKAPPGHPGSPISGFLGIQLGHGLRFTICQAKGIGAELSAVSELDH